MYWFLYRLFRVHTNNKTEIVIAAVFLLLFFLQGEKRVLWKVLWELWFAVYFFIRADYITSNASFLFYIVSVVMVFMAITELVLMLIKKK